MYLVIFTMLYDNPAARLKAILETGIKANKEQQCFIVWSNILESSTNDIGNLLSRLGKAMELSSEIVSLLRTHFPHQVESSPRWRNQIDTAFTHQQLSGKWETFINHINIYCIDSLGLIADLLHSKLGVKAVKNEEIVTLIDQIKTLISEIENSELEDSLKIYLLRELSALLQTLREYKITGTEVVLKQLESMIGHAHRDKEYFAFLKDHELGQRVLDNLNAVAATLTIYLGIPQLSQTASILLPLLPN